MILHLWTNKDFSKERYSYKSSIQKPNYFRKLEWNARIEINPSVKYIIHSCFKKCVLVEMKCSKKFVYKCIRSQNNLNYSNKWKKSYARYEYTLDDDRGYLYIKNHRSNTCVT